MLATVVLAFSAVIALLYTRGQVSALVSAHKQALKTEKGRFLFDLDRMYEDTHFANSRVALYDHIDKIRVDLRKRFPNASHEDQNEMMKEESSKLLFKLMQSNGEEYTQIMKMCGFFETLSFFIKRGYIDYQDVIELYGPALISVVDSCSSHIAKRREMNPVGDTRLYENIDALIERARNNNDLN
tara:strand:+ start:610 stop:1164 length:555 start_codon:yes stop_codon:yes gene_type:complete